MKALTLHAYGAPPVHEEIPVPVPGPDEVLVRVRAASLNPLDVKLQGGKLREFFPLSFSYTLGTDLAGTVERVGSVALRWQPGDKVVARVDPTLGGALAEFAVVPAAYLAAAPSGVGLEEAAGVPTAAGTAWQALFEAARLRQGQTVLIHAGAGGVGSFAIQLARIAGARVVATASGPGVESVRQLGADRVIDYTCESFTEQLSDVDVVIDTVGGQTQQHSFEVLRSGGVLVSIVSPPDAALAKAHGVKADFVFHRSDAGRLGAVLGLLDAGMLQVRVDTRASLRDVGDAFQRQRSGHAHGKILVSIN